MSWKQYPKCVSNSGRAAAYGFRYFAADGGRMSYGGATYSGGRQLMSMAS
jgi:hypothetical protein